MISYYEVSLSWYTYSFFLHTSIRKARADIVCLNLWHGCTMTVNEVIFIFLVMISRLKSHQMMRALQMIFFRPDPNMSDFIT